jgi:hypothetical protein
MMPGYNEQRIRAQLMVWWIIWAAILAGLCLVYFFLGWGKPLPAVSPANPLNGLVGIIPLFLSIIIRWLVLPRYTDPRRALVVFVLGIALAEGCGFLGTFLGGPYRESLFVLGVLGIAQYAPFYARKFFDPKGSGFIPNN